MKIIKADEFGVNDLALEIEYKGIIYKGCITEDEGLQNPKDFGRKTKW